MKDAQILSSQVIVPEFELLAIPLDDIQDLVEDKLEQGFAQAIGECDCVTVTESADFGSMSKIFKAEVAVLSVDEYIRLKRIEDAYMQLMFE